MPKMADVGLAIYRLTKSITSMDYAIYFSSLVGWCHQPVLTAANGSMDRLLRNTRVPNDGGICWGHSHAGRSCRCRSSRLSICQLVLLFDYPFFPPAVLEVSTDATTVLWPGRRSTIRINPARSRAASARLFASRPTPHSAKYLVGRVTFGVRRRSARCRMASSTARALPGSRPARWSSSRLIGPLRKRSMQ